jgi:predicted dinucleotide-binding enzyme
MSSKQNIGIVGAGPVGGALAQRLVALGHQVSIANSRGKATLAALAARTGAEAADLDDLSPGLDLLIIAIPLGQVLRLPRRLISALDSDTVVVDTGNYIPQRDGQIVDIDNGLTETAWVATQLGVPVVKAFNSITAYGLLHHGRAAGDPRRIALPVAGDDDDARATVAALIEQLGYTAVQTGPLAESWRQQPGQPAYCTDGTPDELIQLLARASRDDGPANRDKAMALMAKLPADYSPDELVRVARLSVGLDKFSPGSWLAMLRLGVTMLRASRA